jgi:TetR/AcrR family transcriptional regulator, regulator of cefoperazone and chloramphenicol sensitivity
MPVLAMPAAVPTPSPKPVADTRGRLLDAATAEFAERGFGGARIREIVARAGTNLAAINYHFGGKEALYAAVLEHHARRALATHPTHAAAGTAKLSPRHRLELFIRGLLMRVLDDDPAAMFTRLIAREMLDPTPALDSLAHAFARPQVEALCAIIAEITNAPATSDPVKRCAISVASQCMNLHFQRHLLRRVFPDLPLTVDAVDAIARHILAFSMGGMRAAALAERRSRPTAVAAPRQRRRA